MPQYVSPPSHVRGRNVVSWNYQPGLTSMHLYSTPHSMSWIIFNDSGAGGTEWSGPAGFVKLRDELYYLYWLEEACNGTLGTIAINLRTMHDAGLDYHCGDQGLTLGAVAAAPLAALGAVALAAEHDHEARLARLQDEAAIRDLHQAWLRRINTGEPAAPLFVDPKAARHPGISRVAADHAAAPDEIRLAADGLSASGV